MSKKTGGPAFPVNLLEDERWLGEGTENGMTLRDYFAAKAMSMLIGSGTRQTDPKKIREAIARTAYEIADEMLEQREKE